jgi:hypothetical protein
MRSDRLGWSVQPKIFISLVVIGLPLIAAAAASLIYLYSKSSKTDRDTITFAVTTVGAGLGLYGLLKAADSIRKSNAEKLTSSSLSFVQRWNDHRIGR